MNRRAPYLLLSLSILSPVVVVVSRSSSLAVTMPRPGTVLYAANWSQGLRGWAAHPNGAARGWTAASGMLVYTESNSSDTCITAPYGPGSQGIADYAVQTQLRLGHATVPGMFDFEIDIRTDQYRSTRRMPSGYLVDVSRTIRGPLGSSARLGSYGVKDLTFTTATTFDPGRQWHTYRVEAKGMHLRVIIDGELMLVRKDGRYPAGGYVSLCSFIGGVSARDFKIIAL